MSTIFCMLGAPSNVIICCSPSFQLYLILEIPISHSASIINLLSSVLVKLICAVFSAFFTNVGIFMFPFVIFSYKKYPPNN